MFKPLNLLLLLTMATPMFVSAPASSADQPGAQPSVQPGTAQTGTVPTGTAATGTAPGKSNSASSKWKAVTSRHGHFSVLMPDDVAKSKQHSENHDSTTFFASITEGGKSTDFLISYTNYGSAYASKKSTERLTESDVRMHVSLLLGKITKRRQVVVAGKPATEFDFDGYSRSKRHAKAGKMPDLHGRGRVVWINDIEYALVCTTTRPSIGASCNKFFNSFTLN